MSWILAFLGFAVLIILHEAGHFTAAKAVGMRVERFFLFFPPKVWSIRRGETEYGIGAIPLGGYVRITGMNSEEEVTLDEDGPVLGEAKKVPALEYPRSYCAAPVWKRIVVIAAGPFVNLVIAFVILFFLAFGVGQATNTVESVAKGTPASRVLQPGDRLVSVDGVKGDLETLRDQIATHKCTRAHTDRKAAEPAKIVVSRNGNLVAVTATPVYDAASERPLLGFTYGMRPLDPGVPGAASWALDRMWDVTSQTVGIVGRIFNAEERKQISGAVGAYEVTRES